ncbi:LysM peptidoglycan-binding domain-containing protein [Effusibacillus pohliae]|uniref:LysM peptidoglycan-binding domain-containing protein n=1 Tax=Effusibacillus pohliae TaxID=232270 RepID=UPI00036920C1|nr:LysM peptidoglycan-binding domain-containing protein [Effusibacillus pohliae]
MSAKKKLAAMAAGLSIASLATPALASTYEVKPGDTLWKISRTHHVSLAELTAANPSVHPRNLQIGQAIRVPDGKADADGTYVVTGDDTFWKISRKLHLPLKDLLAANPGVDPLNLYPGVVLRLPKTGVASKPVVSPAATKHATATAAATAGQQPQVKTALGQTLAYSRVISGVATAYTASAQCNGSWGAVDYFGNPLQVGTVAVDPSVIPLGSKLYITGYSFSGLPFGGMIAYARDVGGAIKGNHIDIFVPTSDEEASQFGMQNVKIYILK